MKNITPILLITILSFCITCELQASPRNEIEYQYNTITTLMSGNYQSVVTVGEAKKQVNFGLGAIQNLGELIVLDGVYYEANPQGKIIVLNNEVGISYLTGTEFNPKDDPLFGVQNISLSNLELKIDGYNQSILKARYAAVEVTGELKSITFRSEDKDNSKPGVPLAEWIKDHQNEFTLKDVKGTLIMFYLPSDIQGVGVPGYHVHFINAERTRGGHVLNADILNAKVIFQPLKFLHVYPNAEKASLHGLHAIESSSQH